MVWASVVAQSLVTDVAGVAVRVAKYLAGVADDIRCEIRLPRRIIRLMY
jgi:hypothetical protein